MTRSKHDFIEGEDGFLLFPPMWNKALYDRLGYVVDRNIGTLYLALDTYKDRIAVHYQTPIFSSTKRTPEELLGTESPGFLEWIDLSIESEESPLRRFHWQEGKVVKVDLGRVGQKSSVIVYPFPAALREAFVRENWLARRELRKGDIWVHCRSGRKPTLDFFNHQPDLYWEKDKVWGDIEGETTPQDLPKEDGRIVLRGKDPFESVYSESLIFSSEGLKVRRALVWEGEKFGVPCMVWKLEQESVKKILKEMEKEGGKEKEKKREKRVLHQNEPHRKSGGRNERDE